MHARHEQGLLYTVCHWLERLQGWLNLCKKWRGVKCFTLSSGMAAVKAASLTSKFVCLRSMRRLWVSAILAGARATTRPRLSSSAVHPGLAEGCKFMWLGKSTIFPQRGASCAASSGSLAEVKAKGKALARVVAEQCATPTKDKQSLSW